MGGSPLPEGRDFVSTSEEQSWLFQSGAPQSPGAQPHNCSGSRSRQYGWLSGKGQPGNEVPPAAQHHPSSTAGSPNSPSFSLWRLWRQNPGQQGGEGACSSSGPQLSNSLPQMKGKFKHGGCEALLDKVPRQATLGKARRSHTTHG